MKTNYIPRTERLEGRIQKLTNKLEEAYVPSDSPGNPYWMCKYCRVHDPEQSISGHRKYCPIPGIEKEIEHYKNLLANAP